jgi:alpha-glucosidase
MHAFTEGELRLNSAYGFDFLYADALTPALIARVAKEWPESAGWPSWAFENHDAPRALSRWVNDDDRDRFARIKMLLLACLRGSIIVYQGEELGLPQAHVPFEHLQDPEAIANWPQTLSRDGARTPMPWTPDAPALGFSIGTPWLPASESHRPLAVDAQKQDPGSVLAFTRECLAFRRAHGALRQGSMHIVEASDQLLVFERTGEGECLSCSFNLSDRPVAFTPSGTPLLGTGDIDGGSLGPYAAVVEEIE